MSVTRSLFALLAAAALLGAAPAPCTGGLCNGEVLKAYFAKLARIRRNAGAPPVHILQIGDSHTAGDVTTGALRTLLQAQYGSGGRGVLAAGRPYSGYTTQGVTASMSPGWSIAATFGAGSQGARVPIGVSSFSLTSTVAGASVGLAATDPAMLFDRIVVCALVRPGAGALDVLTSDGISVRLGLAGDSERTRCETFRLAVPQSSLTLTALDLPVTITSVATFRDRGGVALSNVGIVGSQLFHFARTDDAVVAEELRAYLPDLIVLAFGTNEGFSPRFDGYGYEALLRAQVRRLRRLSGGAPMLLLLPPDSLSRQGALRANGEGAPIDCPADAAPLTVDGTTLVQMPWPASNRPPLFAPPALAQVRAIQRRVALAEGVATWDWGTRMGGPCSAQAWVRADPQLMRGDYVHFRNAGGALVARMLQSDLAAAAQAGAPQPAVRR